MKIKDYAEHLRHNGEGEMTDEHEDQTEPHHLDRRVDERARARYARGGLVGKPPERSPLSAAARITDAEEYHATTGLSRHHHSSPEELNSQAHLTPPEKAARRVR